MAPPTASKPDSFIIARLLRYLSIATFPVGIALLIAHGVKSHRVVPALGLLPLAGSSLISTLSVRRRKTLAAWSPVHSIASHSIFFADLALSLGFLAVLIPSWITLSHRRWSDGYNNSIVILGTYCTVLLLLNWFIHTFFTLAYLLHHTVVGLQRWGQNHNGGFAAVWTGPMEHAEEYAPFMDDAAARTSAETRADLDGGEPARPTEDA
ncbi:hypothetical protein O9K51_02071 [Purpureocillium lavendulum]|uniref:Uncharacterized protein n=1 Tax=Purpureocillium lavendulum TaxID=1247861 RepID=A0AB34G9X2_9HYPO|nr:hypothetical protein O9K51_02071 [Purpureocillium lavendulum]